MEQSISSFEGGRVMGVDDEELEYDTTWSASSILCHAPSYGEFDY